MGCRPAFFGSRCFKSDSSMPCRALVCLLKTPKYLSQRELYLFPNSSFDAYFSRCSARRPGFGRPFTGRTPTGELGLASANQRSSPLPQETTEIELWRSPLLGLPGPPLARLALHVSHRETGNRRGLASQRLPAVVDSEGSTRAARSTWHCRRDPRPDPQDVPRESQLGCTAFTASYSSWASLSARLA